MKVYVVTASEFINNITVEGWLRPKLKFKWKNLTCNDEVNQVKIKIEKEIGLTWREQKTLM